MKRLPHFFLLFSLILSLRCAHGAGIDFTEVNTPSQWAQALSTAQAANKMVFVSFAADGNEWCKKMETNVYTDASVAAYFNAQFINVKVGTEPGSFGEGMALEYQASSYPAFVFADAWGNGASATIGYRSPSDLIELATKAVKDQAAWSARVARWQSGKMTTDQLHDMTLQADQRGEGRLAEEIYDAYFAKASDQEKISKQGFDLISMFSYELESEGMEYILAQKDRYRRVAGVGEEGIRAYLGEVVYFQQQVMQQTNDYSNMESVIVKLAPHLAATNGSVLQSVFELRAFFLLEGAQWSAYVKLVESEFPRVTQANFERFYGLVNHHIVQKITSDPLFNESNVKWAKMLRDFAPKYATKFSYGIALYRAGKSEEAIRALRDAQLQAPDEAEKENINMIIEGINKG